MKKRSKMKRWTRMQKSDVFNVILASLTIVLLCVWGGLHWMTNSDAALLASGFDDLNITSLGQESDEQAPQKAEEEEGTGQEPQELTGEEPPEQPEVEQSAITTEPTGRDGGGSSAAPQAVETPKKDQGTAVKQEEQPASNKDAASPASSGNESNSSGSTSETPDAGKSEASNDDKPAAPGTAQTEPPKEEKPSEAGSNQPKPVEPNLPNPTPNPNQPDPPINLEQKYEEQLVVIQAKCTHDAKEVLKGAEASMQQLDKNDPIKVQVWYGKLTEELQIAESGCNNNFNEVIQHAEKDAISSAIIAEWNQIFITLKESLREESEARLQQLLQQ